MVEEHSGKGSVSSSRCLGWRTIIMSIFLLEQEIMFIHRKRLRKSSYLLILLRREMVCRES